MIFNIEILMERTGFMGVRGLSTELTQKSVTNLRPGEQRERIKTNET